MARPSAVTDAEIFKCLNDGMTQAAIAERYGVTPATICNRVKKLKLNNTPPEKEGVPVVFKIMDTVTHRKTRKWFRIIGHEDVFYELRPLGQSKTAGSTNDIEVHVNDLKKNYIKKDYPEVKCYNINEPEGRDKEEPVMGYNTTPKTAVDISGGIPQNNTPTSMPLGTNKEVPENIKGYHGVTTGYFVKREFLHRIDCILDAVGIGASESVMEHTGKLIAQIIEEGVKEEK